MKKIWTIVTHTNTPLPSPLGTESCTAVPLAWLSLSRLFFALYITRIYIYKIHKGHDLRFSTVCLSFTHSYLTFISFFLDYCPALHTFSFFFLHSLLLLSPPISLFWPAFSLILAGFHGFHHRIWLDGMYVLCNALP